MSNNKNQNYVLQGKTRSIAEPKVSFDDFAIPKEIINFPRKKEIPEGYYFSEIIDVDVRITNSGKKCLDVFYYLEGFKEGEYKMRLSYPLNSRPLAEFHAAMKNAGITSENKITDVIGVTEKIRLVYPGDDDDTIGYIHARVYDPVNEDTEACND